MSRSIFALSERRAVCNEVKGSVFSYVVHED
jgi:hypothetical protein